jgi:hypothetical protein
VGMWFRPNVIARSDSLVIVRAGGRSSNRRRHGFSRRPVNTGCPAFAGHDRAGYRGSPLSLRLSQAIPFSRCGAHPRHVRQCEASSEAVRYFVRAGKRRAIRNDGWQGRKPRRKVKKERQGSGTPRDAYPTVRALQRGSAPFPFPSLACGGGSGRGRSPFGVPPRRLL